MPVDTQAQGQAIFRLSKDGSELHFTLIATNIENAFAAHIHLGPAGEDGPVVATLFSAEPGGGRTSGLLARGTITASDLQGPLAGEPLSTLIDAMLAGDTYVNVHTDDGMGAANTGPGDMARGEIRGQVEPHGMRAPERVDAVFAARANRPSLLADNSHAVVEKLYRQLLSRPPEAAGLEHWAGRIQRGEATPGEVAPGIFESNERLDPIIRQMYRDYLFREADEAGVAYWRDQVWKRDGGPENVVAGIVSSREFFQSAGGTNRAWVSQMYSRLLERPADNPGLGFWASRLDSGALTRQQVVLGFARSDESFRALVHEWFSLYLERTPSEGEVNHFVLKLHRGASQRSMQIEMLNSSEYSASV